ncbi:uncharacterized protein LOC119550052 [Drosophila subpulchrella]|uniref:uncharacterized protein LOC119550052 n=1 Tax=Drosophila subpulchrella TaxID=1486046 RepID=UPI0018A12A76|nr:uncharacterized protein LOC119550052 [Drosophila subpulchrella]
MEEELKAFFEDCRRQEFSEKEMLTICQPLIWRIRLARIIKWCFFLLPLVVIYLLWLYSDSFAWSVSAVGRLLLIQILPLWDWTPYYNAKCLISRVESVQEPPPPLGKLETQWQNCALCEALEGIATASNVSYSTVESEYLDRGLPVIITDSGLKMDVPNLLELIEEKSPQWISSDPCDVSSSLMLRKLFNLEAALGKIRSWQGQTSNTWHLQLRNCQKKAVKFSRLFLERPYYYPYHLAPYYSSWLLAVHQQRRKQAEIYVRGLVFMQQLSGHFEVVLQPKNPCDKGVCPSLRMRLNAGEGLIFTTDIWSLSYGLEKPHTKQTSLASIFEVEWQS